jgi:hypothetical protein
LTCVEWWIIRRGSASHAQRLCPGRLHLVMHPSRPVWLIVGESVASAHTNHRSFGRHRLATGDPCVPSGGAADMLAAEKQLIGGSNPADWRYQRLPLTGRESGGAVLNGSPEPES